VNLAAAVREAGACVGDIIEIVSRPHWVTKAIEKELLDEAIGEVPTSAEGLLVEITAIGETAILGYWLQGEPLAGLIGEREPTHYAEFNWDRAGSESANHGGSMVRKVGRREQRSDEVFRVNWLLPDLENVYTRCRKQGGLT
jgi:hypothetical protein